MISRLHYISQATEGKSHLENIKEACAAGVDWVQLRVKEAMDDEELLELAHEAKKVCKAHNAKLIINDHVGIAQRIGAYGVHLGQDDMPPEEARELLNDEAIVGVTANTWDEVHAAFLAGADYVGVGPYKHTDTKENIGSLLGINGYSNIMNNMVIFDVQIPVIAIGGIALPDVLELQFSGVHGVAVASLINRAEDKKEMVENILNCLPDEKL